MTRKVLSINWDYIFNHLRKCEYCQSFQPCEFKELAQQVFEHATCECERCKREKIDY